MPSLSSVLFVGLGGLALLMIGVNVAARWRARRLVGQAVPDGVPAAPGRSLYYFMSPSCGACRAMTPVVRDMAARDDRVHVVDVTRDQDLAIRFGVLATPTTIVVRDGTVERVEVGARPPATLRAMMGT